MSYKGLVVGGHLAGEWRSHDLPSFSDTSPAGGAVYYPNGSVLMWDGEPRLVTWVHVSSEPFAEFWVPEGKTAAWAVAELIRCYREHGRDILSRDTRPVWADD